MGVLDEILVAKRAEAARLAEPERRGALERSLERAAPTRGFAASLRRPDGRLAVIAEIKRRSPSKGVLAADLEAAATAKSYEAGGAVALSVLTDERWFGGSLADLVDARSATRLPVLRKDFVVDELQIDEARAASADAVLLIAAAIPDDDRLTALHAHAAARGLDVLVEVHDEAELDRAIAVGARVVGVNSRNLQTFEEDLSVAERLAARLPDDVVRVGESAVRSPADASRLADAGFDAVLVGEALVRSDDPEALVRAIGEARVHSRR